MENIQISLVIPFNKLSLNSVTLYMQKRSEDGELDGLWEFPGGKVENTESPIEAAKREYLEECKSEVENISFYKSFTYAYETKNLRFHCFTTKIDKPLKHFREFKFDFIAKSSKSKGLFPPANYGLIDEVIEYLRNSNEIIGAS